MLHREKCIRKEVTTTNRHKWRQVFRTLPGPFLSAVSGNSRFKPQSPGETRTPLCLTPLNHCRKQLPENCWSRLSSGLKIGHVANFLFWFLVFLTQHFKLIQTYSLCKSLIPVLRKKNGCKCGFDFFPTLLQLYLSLYVPWLLPPTSVSSIIIFHLNNSS